MNIKPIQDSVIVRQDPAQDKVGSLFVPQGKEIYTDFGTVIAVGSQVKDVKTGDRVIFTRRPSSHLGEGWPEMKDLIRLKESDIVAIVE
jgi:co-chaperonin GroES (HSP10)